MSGNIVDQILQHSKAAGSEATREHVNTLLRSMLASADSDGAKNLYEKLFDTDPGQETLSVDTLFNDEVQKPLLEQSSATGGSKSTLDQILPAVATTLEQQFSGGMKKNATALYSVLKTQEKNFNDGYTKPAPTALADSSPDSAGSAQQSSTQNISHHKTGNRNPNIKWLGFVLAIIAVALLLRTFLLPATLDTEVSTRDEAGVDLSIETRSEDFNQQVSAVFVQSSDALREVKDEASAAATIEKLQLAQQDMKTLSTMWQGLSAENQSLAAPLAAEALRNLRSLLEKKVGETDTGDLLNPALEPILSGFSEFVAE